MEGKTKLLRAFQSNSIRELTDFVNEHHLSKEDIVVLFQETRNSEFLLVYYEEAS